MSSILPITWNDKKNSPLLADFIAKHGAEYCMTAEEINQLRDAVNEMAVIQQSIYLGTAEPTSMPAGTGNRYWTAIVPGTYTNYGGVVVNPNSLAFISATASGAFSVSQVGLDLSLYIKNSAFTISISGENEAVNGYYNANDGVFTPLHVCKSVKFPVDPINTYFATADVNGSLIALAVYYTSAGNFISYEALGNDLSTTNYVKLKLTIPPNAAYVGMTNFSSTEYGKLDMFSEQAVAATIGMIAKIEAQINAAIKDIAPITGVNEAVNGYYEKNNGSFNEFSQYRSVKFPVNPLLDYYATGTVVGSGTALAVYYTSAGNVISSQFAGTSEELLTQYTDQLLTIPANASYVGMSNYSETIYSVLKTIGTVKFLDLNEIKQRLNLLEAEFGGDFSVWVGKKIAWYGTSIPAGYPQSNQDIYSYANKAVNKVGATIQNYCLPNGIIRKFKSTGVATVRSPAMSFTNTEGTINYLTHMVNLIGTENEPDLFVFDYSVNDADEDMTDIQAESLDMTSESLSTFHGSLNFVIKQLLTAKPKARIALFTHFTNDAVIPTDGWGKMNEVIETVGNYWGIPVCKVYKKSGIIKKNGINSITSYMPDNVHPATDPTGNTVEILTNIAYHFLKRIS